jgi:hypothetical protein
MEEGLVWIIPLTIIPLTSLRPCPSSIGHLHVHFGCGWPRWEIRGSTVFGCGWPRGGLFALCVSSISLRQPGACRQKPPFGAFPMKVNEGQ